MSRQHIRILLIEDFEEDYEITRDLLREIDGWDVDLDWVKTFKAGLEVIERGEHDVCLIDHRLGARTGLELLGLAVKNGCSAPLILLTTVKDHELDVAAMNAGAADFLPKSKIDADQLERSIRYALERSRARDQLKQTNERLQRLALSIESVGDAIVMTNTKGVIEFVNPAFTQLTGYTAQEAIGQNPKILKSGVHLREFYTEMWCTIMRGDIWCGEITNRNKDGSHYETQLTIAPVRTGDGHRLGFVSVHANITPLKQAQRQLQCANKALEDKNAKLRELTKTAHRFVDNVAHDFRTPLTVIKEFSSIIADGLGGPVTQQQTEYLEFITTATRDLAQMVDDFLDSSKLRARVLRVDRQRATVDQILASVRSMLRTRAAAKKIRLVEKVPADLPPVFADAEKAARVIVNLVVNAIKFSHAGGDITMWAAARPSGDVEFGVSDFGPGLSTEDLAVIFERFKQVGDVQRASTKGFGLGLNIAKELVWLNLGKVHVESRQGHGSTFSFTLPLCGDAIILERYFERLTELDQPPTQMVVLQVKPTRPDADLEEVRGFLASVCYSMDLILKAVNGESILAIGSTTEPEGWIGRLLAARKTRIQERSGQDLPDLHIHHLSSLPFERMREAAKSSTLTQITELRLCA